MVTYSRPSHCVIMHYRTVIVRCSGNQILFKWFGIFLWANPKLFPFLPFHILPINFNVFISIIPCLFMPKAYIIYKEGKWEEFWNHQTYILNRSENYQSYSIPIACIISCFMFPVSQFDPNFIFCAPPRFPNLEEHLFFLVFTKTM